MSKDNDSKNENEEMSYNDLIKALHDAMELVHILKINAEYYANEESYGDEENPDVPGHWQLSVGQNLGVTGSDFIPDKGEMAKAALEIIDEKLKKDVGLKSLLEQIEREYEGDFADDEQFI